MADWANFCVGASSSRVKFAALGLGGSGKHANVFGENGPIWGRGSLNPHHRREEEGLTSMRGGNTSWKQERGKTSGRLSSMDSSMPPASRMWLTDARVESPIGALLVGVVARGGW